jgi:hypothetical protein
LLPDPARVGADQHWRRFKRARLRVGVDVSGASASTGGVGGGGNGPSYNTDNGSAGATNTGGGGGGSVTVAAPKAGGSGIVIIRYPNIYKLASSTTGAPTQTTANGYFIYTFTASGSITF